jgi:hypothetical protein
VQDVPVRVLGSAEMSRYNEPSLPDPLARLNVTSLKSLGAVIERMKAMSKTVAIDASMPEGTLTVGVHGDVVDIKTYFRGLSSDVPLEAVGDGGGGGKAAGRAAVTVAIKDLHRILKALTTMATDMLLCICPGALVAHKRLDSGLGSLTFILSLVDAGGDAGLAGGGQQPLGLEATAAAGGGGSE